MADDPTNLSLVSQAIARGLSEEDAWRLFRQILDALSHMTKLGIVHRDLKPSNLLMGAQSFTLSRWGSRPLTDFSSTTSL